jgi:hypothetical protein
MKTNKLIHTVRCSDGSIKTLTELFEQTDDIDTITCPELSITITAPHSCHISIFSAKFLASCAHGKILDTDKPNSPYNLMVKKIQPIPQEQLGDLLKELGLD